MLYLSQNHLILPYFFFFFFLIFYVPFKNVAKTQYTSCSPQEAKSSFFFPPFFFLIGLSLS